MISELKKLKNMMNIAEINIKSWFETNNLALNAEKIKKNMFNLRHIKEYD